MTKTAFFAVGIVFCLVFNAFGKVSALDCYILPQIKNQDRTTCTGSNEVCYRDRTTLPNSTEVILKGCMDRNNRILGCSAGAANTNEKCYCDSSLCNSAVKAGQLGVFGFVCSLIVMTFTQRIL
ncbi:uncharacterized protein LOC129589664 [Paramacrobiotus metropolitanus]|uniref:uncharacterized protein LOC129589664 n=1 Tax=Paramacrobiotus metropolitanus TaxID=2943436 RepID=UPI00244606FE|nr:uncharacterized protein LOC129589664 [Paramacrobiotus metropolitanus]